MCGIAGLAGGRDAPDRAVLGTMLDALAHRGPDAAADASGPGWAIGARRLAVIDLETGGQPVRNETGEIHAVLNGEIYNYAELREELIAGGHRLTSAGDTEVLVHLWEAYGAGMLGRLRGMFALALVDMRKGTLFLARDRVGKKPLYWTRQGGRMVFASELKALRPALPARPHVERDALSSFLAFGFVPEGQCILQGVNKLPPAHWLSLDLLTGEVTQRRYWRLELVPDESIDFLQAVEEVRDLLASAAVARLRSDVPLALFLSGGIDSGMVAAACAREGRGLRSMHVRFGKGSMESRLARVTAARLGLELEEIEIRPGEGLDLLPRLADVYDEPLADSSAIPTVLMAKAARESATVVLNGDGGDEGFAGYRRFIAARLGGLPGAQVWGPAFAGLAAPLIGAGRSERLRAGLGARGGQGYLSWGPIKFSAAEVAELTGGGPPVCPPLAALLERASGLDSVNATRLFEFEFFLPGDLLVKMDRATMAVGLEARSPWLDHLLLERAARFDPSILLRGWRTKAVLRRAAQGMLPEAVRLGRKRGFEVPLRRWLAGEWSGEVRTVLQDPQAEIRRFLRGKAVEVWRNWEWRSDRVRAARAVYTLLTLEHWLRRWL
ncbi:MAG: asparagine synthase (glutamine-hydrolyzing) [Acidobacteriota bacterium]